MQWLKQSFIALDQFVNAFLFFGMADETLSARCWRNRNNSFWWMFWRIAIDLVALLVLDFNHCEQSYLSEVNRKQLPRDYQ